MHLLIHDSTATALEFQMRQGNDALVDATTISFTMKMNQLFDALNRKHPGKGVKVDSTDIKVSIHFIQNKDYDGIIWIDTWEKFITNHLPEDERGMFLSRQTAESLHLTLRNSLKLTEKLLLEDEFQYVLTARFNQDPLELFFGVLCQSSGTDNHPSTLQFTYLYSTLKKVALFKNKEKQSLQLKLQSKMEEILNSPKEYECVLTVDSGYIARKLINGKCTTCVKSILAPKASPSIPSRTSELTMLTDIRQKFKLLYPSEALLVLMDARLSEKQVGCNVSEHKTSLTAKVTNFFVVCHIHFLPEK
ncbi:hypothetical protein CHUAL_009526 [Chamberlinius hualienensis]